jgi:hypothetical protein
MRPAVVAITFTDAKSSQLAAVQTQALPFRSEDCLQWTMNAFVRNDTPGQRFHGRLPDEALSAPQPHGPVPRIRAGHPWTHYRAC